MRERLIEIMKVLKLRNADLARIMNVTLDQINLYLSYRNRNKNNISTNKLILLLDHFPDINANYLLTGRGKPFLSDDSNKDEKSKDHNKEPEEKSKVKDELEKVRDDDLLAELIELRNTIIQLRDEITECESLLIDEKEKEPVPDFL